MATPEPAPSAAVTPVGVNHLVLNVRDLERAHRFWTEIMGFRQVGELTPSPERPRPARMRFYSGTSRSHHDLALMEVAGPGAAESEEAWSMAARRPGLNHLAIHYPDRASWQRQLRFLQAKGVPFHIRLDHGMTHSVYISDPDGHGIEVLYELPREVWEGDINAALNYAKALPTEGEAALADDEPAPTFGRGTPATR